MQPGRKVTEGVDIWVISLCGILPETLEAELIESVEAGSGPWHGPLYWLHGLVHLKAFLSCHPVHRLMGRYDNQTLNFSPFLYSKGDRQKS